MQLLGMHKEGDPASDRAPGAIRVVARRGGARDLSIQYQYGQAHLLSGLRDAPVLCAALGSGQNQRQCPLPRRRRSGKATPKPFFRRQKLGRGSAEPTRIRGGWVSVARTSLL